MSDSKDAVTVNETGVDPRSVDAAWRFLDDHHATAHVEAVDPKALRRRIDWRILPLAFLCYTMQFIDKVLINVSDFLLLSHRNIVDCAAVCRGHGSTKGLEAEGQ